MIFLDGQGVTPDYHTKQAEKIILSNPSIFGMALRLRIHSRYPAGCPECSKKNMDHFFRFFGKNGHPIAAVKLSLSDVATHFRSAIDLWRSQGRFIGLNEEHENLQKS